MNENQNPAAMAEERTCYIHVTAPDGKELRFSAKPQGLSVLTVTINGSIESTITRARNFWDENNFRHWVWPRPPGRGWRQVEHHAEYARWERPRIVGGAS